MKDTKYNTGEIVCIDNIKYDMDYYAITSRL